MLMLIFLLLESLWKISHFLCNFTKGTLCLQLQDIEYFDYVLLEIFIMNPFTVMVTLKKFFLLKWLKNGRLFTKIVLAIGCTSLKDFNHLYYSISLRQFTFFCVVHLISINVEIGSTMIDGMINQAIVSDNSIQCFCSPPCYVVSQVKSMIIKKSWSCCFLIK